MEFKLPYEIKRRLYEEITNFKNPFNLSNEYSIVDFLLEITDLYDIPSSNKENENGYQEALENLVRTNDWSHGYAFKRFGIIDDNQLFKKFIEVVLNKNSHDESFESLAQIINNILKKYFYEIGIHPDGNFNFHYYISKTKNKFDFGEITENDIPIFVVDKNFDTISDNYPCFALIYNSWNDYGYETSFDLAYYETEGNPNFIGRIKILNINASRTIEVIDKKFYKLNDEYCSLLQYADLYIVLKDILKEKTLSFLAAINDVGVFPSICEKYENEEGFKVSLLRNDKQTEKIFRTARYMLEYGDISDLFNFEFIFNPIYSENSVNFKFDYDTTKVIPKRLYCIIGKNGVGKTLMIRKLLSDLSEKSFEKILPRIPLYGKIIFVSYSYFDTFDDIKNTINFNFLFCGLIDSVTKKPLSNEEMLFKIQNSITKIEEKEVLIKYFNILRIFIEIDVLKRIFSILTINDNDRININSVLEEDTIIDVSIFKDKISFTFNDLSSGQKALFFIVTELIANIRYNSLLIFDEPETHLHPNAITEFMSVIMQLLEEFDSYCIVATHSPLIVREVFSDSIYVFEKDEKTPRIRNLEFETFGENLSIITEEIFGNRDVSKYYIESIEKLVKQGKSYNEIENLIQGDVPLNLNVKILIKSLVKNRDEESELL